MAVSVQDGDPESMLAFYRRMLAWRKARPALGKGSFALQETSDSLISYVRTSGATSIFCAFNLGADPLVAALPEGAWRVDRRDRLRRARSSGGRWSCRPIRRSSRSAPKIAVEFIIRID